MGSELAAIAQAQLRAWEEYAREWPLRMVHRENGNHLVCAVCEHTLLPVSYRGQAYTFTGNTTLAATVAHLRNVHRWTEEEVYKDGNGNRRANAQTDSRAGDASSGHIRIAGTD
jgi:hypothetical protein